ncbi:hypothetical protein SAMN05216436_102125 [bacterium A37T11]|nr:hypothetical protein SAMN05216436_102125 [bacterium A37T11]
MVTTQFIKLLPEDVPAVKEWPQWLRKFPWMIGWLPVFMLVYLWSGPLLRYWDATVSVPDVGTLVFLPLAAFFGLSFYGLAWVLSQQLIPVHVNQLTPWQQCMHYTTTFFLCFFGFILVLAVMLS